MAVRVLCLALLLEDSTASFLEKGRAEVRTVSLALQQRALSSLASALRQLAFNSCYLVQLLLPFLLWLMQSG